MAGIYQYLALRVVPDHLAPSSYSIDIFERETCRLLKHLISHIYSL